MLWSTRLRHHVVVYVKVVTSVWEEHVVSIFRVHTCRVDHSSLSAHHSYLITQEANRYKTTPYT
jgi:hypothetical protein